MAYKTLYIWVEGADDVLFFDKIIKPIFAERYDGVEVREYAKKQNVYITKFLKSIQKMKDDYILVADINSSACITGRKQRIKKAFKNIDETKTIVTVQEIESWYLAGLDDSTSKKLGLSVFNVTEKLTKEQFNSLMPKNFNSRIDFMVEILNHFSLKTAKQKNSSFNYFVEKYQLEVNYDRGLR